MFKHFRERLAFAICPWVRPMTVVERITPYINAPTTTAPTGRVQMWIPGDGWKVTS